MPGKDPSAVVGAVEHGNSFEMVTVSGGSVVDRRRVDLTKGLPTHPYHHQGSWAVGRYTESPWAKEITLDEAIALVQRVETASAAGAEAVVATLANAIKVPIIGIAIRACQVLPATIEARIKDNRAQTYADTVMYRLALASAAEARGWAVHWYDPEKVFGDAAKALGIKDIAPALADIGKKLGPPWQAKHKLAAAAAIAAS